jgi:hypothetical protein
MSATIILGRQEQRDKAIRWIKAAPPGSRVEFKGPRRSLPQNALLWCCLTDFAEQLPWHGMRLTAEDYKLIMLDGLKSEMRIVPNMNGTGFVNLGRSSSRLSVSEMADLITLVHAFGASHGVVFGDYQGVKA